MCSLEVFDQSKTLYIIFSISKLHYLTHLGLEEGFYIDLFGFRKLWKKKKKKKKSKLSEALEFNDSFLGVAEEESFHKWRPQHCLGLWSLHAYSTNCSDLISSPLITESSITHAVMQSNPQITYCDTAPQPCCKCSLWIFVSDSLLCFSPFLCQGESWPRLQPCSPSSATLPPHSPFHATLLTQETLRCPLFLLVRIWFCDGAGLYFTGAT